MCADKKVKDKEEQFLKWLGMEMPPLIRGRLRMIFQDCYEPLVKQTRCRQCTPNRLTYRFLLSRRILLLSRLGADSL